MNENFIQFIWKYQQFDAKELTTSDGQDMVVFHPGNHNQDSGPDFEEARIKIDKLEWNGSVEIHVKSSDWKKHNHSENKAYENVILHVVWKHDQKLVLNGEEIPTIELKDLVSPQFIRDYQDHISKKETIACASQLSPKLGMSYLSMIDRVLVERLERKSEEIISTLEETKNSWDEVCYKLLLRNFGFSTNKAAFEKLGQNVPYATLKKILIDPEKVEALLFGQAGFLVSPKESYQQNLEEQFAYLKVKHQLPLSLQKHEWKFGKMRPGNFPALRIAQISGLLHSRPRFFTSLIDAMNTKEMLSLLEFKLSDYWNEHYDFGKRRKSPKNVVGKQTIDNIIINTLAPILAAYAKHVKDQSYMNKAIELLEKVTAEKNRITKEWIRIGKAPKNAFESQAQIQLFDQYCKKRRCLSCSVGVKLLGR